MARSVYVTAMEPGSGKSAVVLGLTEVLSRHAARLAFYRPLVASAGTPDTAIELIRHRYRLPPERVASTLTADDLHGFEGRDEYDALLKRVLDGYTALAGDADVVVIEGSDFTEASPAVELDLTSMWPATWAARCCWWWAVGADPPTRCWTRCTRAWACSPNTAAYCSAWCATGWRRNWWTRSGRSSPRQPTDRRPRSCPRYRCSPRPPLAEVATRLNAEYLARPVGVGAATPREVTRVVVGAMGLPLFLQRYREAIW